MRKKKRPQMDESKGHGPDMHGPNNDVFEAYGYLLDFPGLAAKEQTPGGPGFYTGKAFYPQEVKGSRK